jgi:hypothetical protein
MMPYVLHAASILACCLIFYKLLLQKETFYQLNRYVLLACLVLSFSLPLLPVPQQFSLHKVNPPVVINTIEAAPAHRVTVKHFQQDQNYSTPINGVDRLFDSNDDVVKWANS